MSFDEILQRDAEEYNSCEFDWNCQKCYKFIDIFDMIRLAMMFGRGGQ
jgi:hypothetical protein